MVASEAVFELPSRARWTLLTAALTISCFYNAKVEADDKNWGLFALQIVGGVIGITLVPRSGRARDARPPSPPWSLPARRAPRASRAAFTRRSGSPAAALDSAIQSIYGENTTTI